jgi:hypothetical protein
MRLSVGERKLHLNTVGCSDYQITKANLTPYAFGAVVNIRIEVCEMPCFEWP